MSGREISCLVRACGAIIRLAPIATMHTCISNAYIECHDGGASLTLKRGPAQQEQPAGAFLHFVRAGYPFGEIFDIIHSDESASLICKSQPLKK